MQWAYILLLNVYKGDKIVHENKYMALTLKLYTLNKLKHSKYFLDFRLGSTIESCYNGVF